MQNKSGKTHKLFVKTEFLLPLSHYLRSVGVGVVGGGIDKKVIKNVVRTTSVMGTLKKYKIILFQPSVETWDSKTAPIRNPKNLTLPQNGPGRSWGSPGLPK